MIASTPSPKSPPEEEQTLLNALEAALARPEPALRLAV
jgi:hypothetical protein